MNINNWFLLTRFEIVNERHIMLLLQNIFITYFIYVTVACYSFMTGKWQLNETMFTFTFLFFSGKYVLNYISTNDIFPSNGLEI